MSDLTKLSDQDLRDIERATDLAVRKINVMSETASRLMDLEKRVRAELKRRTG
jgi:hypothetical protein